MTLGFTTFSYENTCSFNLVLFPYVVLLHSSSALVIRLRLERVLQITLVYHLYPDQNLIPKNRNQNCFLIVLSLNFDFKKV